MAELSIKPRFDFSNIVPIEGPGQNHTRAKTPNNSLAPEKFNEYERVMVELAEAVGDYGFSTLIPGAHDTIGSAIQKVWEYYTTDIPDLTAKVDSVEDIVENVTTLYSDEIASLSSDLTSFHDTLQENKFDKTGGTITGAVTIAGSLSSENAVILNNLSVSGEIIASNGLTVNNALLTATQGIAITGTGTITSDLTIGGNSTINGTEGIYVTAGNIYGNHDLFIAHNATISGEVSVSERIISHALSIMWAPAKNYVIGDIVLYNNAFYICSTPHVSDSIFAPGFWDSITATPITGTIDESMVSSSFLNEIKTDPVGTVKFFDGAAWVDNSTIPGWYACTGNNETPDLRDSFILCGDIEDRGYFGGAFAGNNKHMITLSVDQLPIHSHSLNAHTHTVPIDHNHDSETYVTDSDGEHSHNVRSQSPPPPGTESAIDADIVTTADLLTTDTLAISLDGHHTHSVDIDISEITQNNTSQGPNVTNTGQEGTGEVIDITPYYYKMLVIKRMS